MKHYNILLRLSGSRDNEVRKFGVPAAEVILLNALHGGEAVAELAEVEGGEKPFVSRDHRQLRARMVETYGQRPENRALITATFGNIGNLPEAVSKDDLMPEPDVTEDLDDVEAKDAAKPETAPAHRETPEIRAASEEPEDPKEAVKASIRELGGEVPRGNASIETLRAKLQELQRERLGLADEPDAPETNDVMA